MEKFQKLKKDVQASLDKIREKGRNYFCRNWQDTYPPVYLALMAALCIVVGSFTKPLLPNPALGFIMGAVTAFLLGNIGLGILGWILRQFRKVESKHLLCILFLTLLSGMLGVSGNLGNAAGEGFLFGILLALSLILFGKSLWAFFRNKVHTPTIVITGCISGIVFLSGCILLAQTGFQDEYIEEYLSLHEKLSAAQAPEEFENELSFGSYTVESLEYSPEKEAEIKSETIDLSYCAENPGGLTGLWRSAVTGYDVEEAPIAGKVWYPSELDNCPVLFFVHGNHGTLTESYQGYAYLGEYLASHGYVVASVDENVLNLLSNENDARAILLLENIRKLQEFNAEEGNPLYGRMDYDNIVIAGHSRGGEMASTAYLFNGYDAYPENGNHRFRYNFHIKGVIAVAPSVNQYMPAGHEVELENVNYLLLQGANDQDINIFLGNTQYENISFTEDNDYIKSSLYIAGANHGQFNSLWGTYDMSAPLDRYLNVGNFISEEEQQEILKIYTKVFLDKVLKSEDTYESLLTDYSRYSAYLPETVYIQQYEKSGSRMLCDFEEDSDLETASDEEVSLSAEEVYLWREEMLYYSNEMAELNRGNYALRLMWKDTSDACYVLNMQEPVSLVDNKINFDICDMDEYAVEKEEYCCMIPQIVVSDSEGNQAVVSPQDTVIYPPLPVKLGKTQYFLDSNEYKHQYQTISVTSEQLKEQCPKLELSQIKKIELTFPEDESGNVSIDNICLMKE